MHIQADRSDATYDDMQASTVKHIKERHHPSSSPDANPNDQATNTSRMSEGDVVEAVYEREEVSGPLKGNSGSRVSVEEIDCVIRRGPPRAQ